MCFFSISKIVSAYIALFLVGGNGFQSVKFWNFDLFKLDGVLAVKSFLVGLKYPSLSKKPTSPAKSLLTMLRFKKDIFPKKNETQV